MRLKKMIYLIYLFSLNCYSQQLANNSFEKWDSLVVPRPSGWYGDGLMLSEETDIASLGDKGAKIFFYREPKKDIGGMIIYANLLPSHEFVCKELHCSPSILALDYKWFVDSICPHSSNVTLLLKNGEKVVYEDEIILKDQISEFSTLKIPLPGEAIDSVMLKISVDPTSNCKGSKSFLVIDNVRFLENDFGFENQDFFNSNIFPNPFCDILNIRIKDQNINKILLYDDKSREQKITYINKNGVIQIHTDNLEKGIYILKVISETKEFSYKVIKQ